MIRKVSSQAKRSRNRLRPHRIRDDDVGKREVAGLSGEPTGTASHISVARLVPDANGETGLDAMEGDWMHAAPGDLPVLVEMPGFSSRLTHSGELDVAVERLAGGRDPTELFRRAGFPEGRCQVPHWGYLIKGRMRVGYPDHDEVISAGEIWYMPPGHLPATEEDVENIVFTLAGEYEKLMAAFARTASR